MRYDHMSNEKARKLFQERIEAQRLLGKGVVIHYKRPLTILHPFLKNEFREKHQDGRYCVLIDEILKENVYVHGFVTIKEDIRPDQCSDALIAHVGLSAEILILDWVWITADGEVSPIIRKEY